MNEKREQPPFVLKEQGAVYSKSILGFSGLYCTLSTPDTTSLLQRVQKNWLISPFSVLLMKQGDPSVPDSGYFRTKGFTLYIMLKVVSCPLFCAHLDESHNDSFQGNKTSPGLWQLRATVA